ncbi:MAG: arsenic resistance N-acetyltransferase ArsN2 [Candidatus Kariarchaeaceae archaeon]|jgi:amino-acid N-acetyltransferase
MSSITKAITQDLPGVLKLLKLVDLPIEGVKEHFHNFFIVKKNKITLGCIGIEIYENVGLLRSLAIHPSFQGKGIGQQMVSKIEEYSAEKGLHNIYLLTETAEKFFLKLGYQFISREETDTKIKQSIEFTTLCSSSPVMVKDRASI